MRISELLDLYERNYRKLERLLPELDLPFDTAVSRAGDDPALHLQVIERAPYTCEFRLSHRFGAYSDPDLHLRVYRDAALVEALRCERAPPASEYDAEALEKQSSAQWARNLLLGKWLDWLLERGHGFSMAARPRNKMATMVCAGPRDDDP